MHGINKVLIAGNLTQEPEIRYTPKGSAVCTLDIALNSTYKKKDGTLKENVVYVQVVVWGKLAETIKLNLSKGSPLMVDGRLYTEFWKDKNGKEYSKLKIVANNLNFLPEKNI